MGKSVSLQIARSSYVRAGKINKIALRRMILPYLPGYGLSAPASRLSYVPKKPIKPIAIASFPVFPIYRKEKLLPEHPSMEILSSKASWRYRFGEQEPVCLSKKGLSEKTAFRASAFIRETWNMGNGKSRSIESSAFRFRSQFPRALLETSGSDGKSRKFLRERFAATGKTYRSANR